MTDRAAGRLQSGSSGSFSRRLLLQGAGVAVALPWLESLTAREAAKGSRAATCTPPGSWNSAVANKLPFGETQCR